jgi:division protein CdvB (Snf7/Vps24/ESCRT-III family)
MTARGVIVEKGSERRKEIGEYLNNSCKLQAASYKLQATSYKLQATSYKLQAASCKLQAASYSMTGL